MPNALLLSVVGADLPNIPPSLSAYAALGATSRARARCTRAEDGLLPANLLLWAERAHVARAAVAVRFALRPRGAAQGSVIQVVTNLTAAPSDTTTGRSGVGERCPYALDDSADRRILRLTGPQALGGAENTPTRSRGMWAAQSALSPRRANAWRHCCAAGAARRERGAAAPRFARAAGGRPRATT